MKLLRFRRPRRSTHGRRRMSLRLRLALWSAGLVLILSFTLLFFINIAAISGFERSTKNIIFDLKYQQAHVVNATDVRQDKGLPPSLVEKITTQLSRAHFNPFERALLLELQGISLIGLGLVAVLGGIGAYLLAGVALRPLRRVSDAARRIEAETLHTRLALTGPQDEIRELADAFDAMLERLEQTFEQQRRFVASAAHELRTPLAAMRTNLEVVASDPEATLEDYREMSAVQERGLARLEALVSNMLLLVKSEQPLGASSAVSLGPLLEEALQELAPAADEHNVTLSLETSADVVVAGDELLLMRVFCNLLENAIYYNRPGGEVCVSITQTAERAQVSVADTGVGIAPEEQERIFDRFYRVESSRSRRSGGAGLGLSIVSAIVQQHGGEVQVSSAPDLGSTITVILPLCNSAEAECEQEAITQVALLPA